MPVNLSVQGSTIQNSTCYVQMHNAATFPLRHNPVTARQKAVPLEQDIAGRQEAGRKMQNSSSGLDNLICWRIGLQQ